MTVGKINLNWSDFLANVSRSFSNLHGDDLFTDVTLVSDDNKQIGAHKLILSAGSEFFRNILADKSHVHPMLCLDGVNSEELNMIIRYLYVGEVSVPQTSLQNFLKVAQKLKCFGLNEKEPEEQEQRSQMNENLLRSEDSVISQHETIEEINQELQIIDEASFIIENEVSEQLDTIDNEQTWIKSETQVSAEILPEVFENTETEKAKIEDRNGSEKDVKSRNGRKELMDRLPEYCRIEGQTFSIDQLRQYLEQFYECTVEKKYRIKGMHFYACKHCKKEFNNKTKLFEHVQKHIENLEFDCKRMCGKIFSTTGSFRRHNCENNI